jgi:hypothetical protein
MRWRVGQIAIGCGLILATGTPALGARSSTSVPPARPLLITRAELGAGWSRSAAAPGHVPALSCHTLPTALRSARRHAAASVTWTQGNAGPFVQQTVFRWASAATATAIWRQLARPSLLTCLARSLTHGGSSGVTFTVTGRHPLTAPHLSVGIRAYRVRATAVIGGQQFPAYLDELVLNTGGAISELSVATYEEPPTAAVEARIARLVARRGLKAARAVSPRSH